MSKTFKANPTTDKHNLRKRILEIESNPTTTTTTTSTTTLVQKITSGDVGDGLVVNDDDKLNLSLGDGLKIDDDKKIQLSFSETESGHLKYDTTYGIIVKSNVLTARHLAPSVTWGDTLERNTSTFLIEVKDYSIKPVKLDIANEAMFRAMCVNRTAWINFQSFGSTAGGIDIQLNNYFYSSDAQYSVETFHYNDSTRLDWYRVHLRGRVSKQTMWVDSDVMAVINNSALRPDKSTSRRLSIYDFDGPTDKHTSITVSINPLSGNIYIDEIRDASNHFYLTSYVDLGGVIFETRP